LYLSRVKLRTAYNVAEGTQMVPCYMTQHLISHIKGKSQTDYRVSVGALREILGTVRQEVTADEENWEMKSFIICARHQILLRFQSGRTG
jgi:hypothetical protein